MRRALLLTLSAAASLVAAGLPTATASTSDDAALVSATNTARSQHGYAPYAVAGDLAAAARRHATEMAARRMIYHDANIGSRVCCWSDLGDNVGAGPSASAVHNAFMASREHRANIMSPTYTQIGVGTARGSDGRLYVDEIFRRPEGASALAVPASRVAADSPRPGPAPAATARAQQPSMVEVLQPRLQWLTAHYPPLRGHYDPVRQSLRFDAVMSRFSAY